MSSLYERLAENFQRWEVRGRGCLLHDAPVSPAPLFVPFPGHRLHAEKPVDDGSRPTLLSRLAGRIAQSVLPPKTLEGKAPADESTEPEPNWIEERAYREIQVLLPKAAKIDAGAFAHFLSGISYCRRPVVFEIVGDARRVVCRLCATDDDAPMVERQLKAHFPELSILMTELALQQAWLSEEDAEHVEIELGLAEVFMLPLADSRSDVFVGLVGALSNLASGECGVYQVIFSPLTEPWAENAVGAVTGSQAELLIEGLPHLAKATSEKVSRPLFGVVVRLGARAWEMDRVWEIIREMAAPFRQFSKHGRNELMPMPNIGYPHGEHERDLLFRQSRRSGMILNLDELMGFVHLPSPAVRSARFASVDEHTRAVGSIGAMEEGVCLGLNSHAGEEREVWLNNEQRVRHLHCIGGTGSGKSTLLFNLMLQDIRNGEGLALLDPHGDLVDRVLGSIPPERVEDVVLLDPSDEGFVVPFNVLSAHSDFEKTILASDLVSVFRMQSTSWGDQMQSVMQNAVLAFLESTEGGTLADMRRFLLDPAWRERFLETVTDPEVCYYWRRGFPLLGSGKSIGPILTRLESFLSPKPIRHMVSQKENRLDFADIMDSGKILLVRLPQGQMGRDNAFLLGSLVMAKLQQTIMSRQRIEARQRRPFFLYVDECQQFITPSMAEILSGARKYGVGLILAHQELRQLERDKEVSSALLANAFTRVVFRVGDADARNLAEGFAHFEAKDIQRLPIGEALCRIERADNDFNLAIPLPDEVDDNQAAITRRTVVEKSRAAYARKRSEVEAEMLAAFEAQSVAAEETSSRKPKPTKTTPSPSPEIAGDDKRPPSDEQKPSTMVELAPAVESQPTPAGSPMSSGMGRGGLDHQLIVEQLFKEAGQFGYKASKEFEVPGGRVDLALEKRDRRIAIEVAVNSNTTHEIENLQKCLAGGFDSVVSVSPLPSVIENIRRAAMKQLSPEQFERVQFHSSESLLSWLEKMSSRETQSQAPEDDGVKTFGGRRVRIKHVQLTSEEQFRMEKENLAVIAEILSKECSTGDLELG